VRLRTLSIIGMLNVLQQHGLTEAMLREWVRACADKHTGQVTFQVTQGRLRSLDVTAVSTRRLRLTPD
jgi:hypothetical protein